MTQETTYTAPESVGRLGRIGLAVGAAGTAACVAGAFVAREQLFRSYLSGYMWMLSFAVGSLGLLMLQHLTRGAWGVMIRRILEAGARTLPFVALAFLPVVAGLHTLYEWTHADVVAKDPVLLHKAPWLSEGPFLVRAAIYFACWIFLAFLLTRKSREQDATGDRALALSMQRWSAGGLLVFFATVTFASFDWTMSLTPHWYSTIYGLYVAIGSAVASMALVCLMVLVLGAGARPSVPFQARHLHDYGKLLFAFVCMWAYFAYSQFIIIWSGNLPEETSFFVPRLNGGWKATSVALVAFQYALPFVLLLSRGRKRDAARLAPVAALVLVARWLDFHWLVAPAFSPHAFTLHWLDLAVPAALGGLWFWLFTLELRKGSLLPVREPFLQEALAHE